DILQKISQILGDGLELSEVFQRAMTVLCERLGFQRASLVLWDASSEQYRIVAAVGLSREEMARGRYAPGEGVTGKVLATGQPQVVADVLKHPDFLNRTRARPLDGPGSATGGEPISFIGVPVKDGDQYVGAITVDKPYSDEQTLAADTR